VSCVGNNWTAELTERDYAAKEVESRPFRAFCLRDVLSLNDSQRFVPRATTAINVLDATQNAEPIGSAFLLTTRSRYFEEKKRAPPIVLEHTTQRLTA
jgi:hypothetical protein